MLRASGFNLVDYGRKTVDELVTCVVEDKIEILLVSVLLLPSALKVKQLQEKLKQANSNAILIVGGAPLSRPGKLTDIEFCLIKTHAQVGFEIVENVKFIQPIAKMISQHHERLDGSGYSHGLKEGDIVPEAKIIAVADVVEAMASHRPYRASLGIDAALEEIKRGSGTKYDANVVNQCVSLFREDGYMFPVNSEPIKSMP